MSNYQLTITVVILWDLLRLSRKSKMAKWYMVHRLAIKGTFTESFSESPPLLTELWPKNLFSGKLVKFWACTGGKVGQKYQHRVTVTRYDMFGQLLVISSYI